MNTLAVVLERPEHLALSRLDLTPPGEDDVVVDIEWSGISTGTERLLWSGRMPRFPGHGLPARSRLRVGRPRREAGPRSGGAGRRARVRARRALLRRGARPVRRRRLAGGRPGRAGRADRRAIWANRACCWRWPRPPTTPSRGGAATARPDRRPRRARPAAGAADGRGGRARRSSGSATRSARGGAVGYRGHRSRPTTRAATTAPSATSAATPSLLDTLIARLAPGRRDRARRLLQRAALVRLPAGLHARGARSASPPNGSEPDLLAVRELIESGRAVARRPDHPSPAGRATRPTAYRTAFGDPACLKMVLDWRACS